MPSNYPAPLWPSSAIWPLSDLLPGSALLKFIKAPLYSYFWLWWRPTSRLVSAPLIIRRATGHSTLSDDSAFLWALSAIARLHSALSHRLAPFWQLGFILSDRSGSWPISATVERSTSGDLCSGVLYHWVSSPRFSSFRGNNTSVFQHHFLPLRLQHSLRQVGRRETHRLYTTGRGVGLGSEGKQDDQG